MKVNSTFKLEKINHRYFAFDGGTGNIFEISEILYEILLNRNEKLIDECSKYYFPLINTSKGEERDRIIDNVINNLLEGKYEDNSISEQ